MANNAIITCDYGLCDEKQLFPNESPPPRDWYVVRHPVKMKAPGATRPASGESTFCSSEHLSLWARGYRWEDAEH